MAGWLAQSRLALLLLLVTLAGLSEIGRRCEKAAWRGPDLQDLQPQYRDIDQKVREIWPVQAIFQPLGPAAVLVESPSSSPLAGAYVGHKKIMLKFRP